MSNTQTGTINDWIPTGTTGVNSLVEWSGTGDLTVTGLASGVSGQSFTFRNLAAANNAFFNNANTGSTAADRLVNTVTSFGTPVAPGGYIQYVWDGTNWKLVNHNQGGLIQYSASSSIVGWASFIVKTIQYQLVGAQLTVTFDLEGVSNATGATFSIPFTCTATRSYFIMDAYDNSTPDVVGEVRNQVSTGVLEAFAGLARPNWTTSGNKGAIGTWIGAVT